VPHLVPLDRGILETIYVSLKKGTTEAQVTQALEVPIAMRRFVSYRSDAPEIKHTFRHTRTSVTSDEGRREPSSPRADCRARYLVRGAGQAVQNLNIVLGLHERRVCSDGGGQEQSTGRAELGGELLRAAWGLMRRPEGIAALARRTALVVVHGGGREIDAALATAGIPKQQ